MSVKILVIGEDPTNNGYILKPLVEKLATECGKPNAKVTMLNSPRTQGYEHAKGLLRDEIVVDYKHMSLLVFLPDADGKDKSHELRGLEEAAEAQGVRLICCAAREEVETWLLAGYYDELGLSWSDVQSNTSVKEEVFEPFLRRRGNGRVPGGGREELMRNALSSSYAGILKRCPELAELKRRICEVLSS